MVGHFGVLRFAVGKGLNAGARVEITNREHAVDGGEGGDNGLGLRLSTSTSVYAISRAND